MKLSQVIKNIWSYLRPYKFSFFLAVILVIVTVFMSVLEPVIFGWIITELMSNVSDMIQGVEGAGVNYSYIFKVMVIYMIRSLIVQIGTYGSRFYITNAVQRMVYDLRVDIVERLNYLPVAFFDRHQFGDILGRITSDVETISNALQQSLISLIQGVLTILFVTGMMFYLNWRLAIIVLLIVPIGYAAIRFLMKLSQPYFNRQAAILGKMNGFVQENFTGFNVNMLYGREEIAGRDFREITDELAKVGYKATFISAVMTPVTATIANCAYITVAVYGGLQVIAKRLTIGNLQAFIQYVWQITNPLQTITQLAGVMQAASAAVGRIWQVLEEPLEVDTATRQLDWDPTGQIGFNEVDFRYVPERPLINDFNVDVKPGEMIAIVGPTGAGKTTMINLLMRFYDVTKGSITIDGVDIRDLPRQEYRQQFGMVLQDAWLFEGTIKENLRFGRLDATDEEIVAACQAANVDHFIRTLPDGYNMRMNQESSNISQGQKQLLTIARALLSDPKILILDEATSSVDTRLELLIQDAMANLMRGRTSFVIAHRLSTIQDADRILVMQDGEIIEQGNHDQLMAQGGFYHDLYQSQFNQA